MSLPLRRVNSRLTTSARTVYLIDTIDCHPGTSLRLVFESAEPRWRQGVFLGVHGELAIANEVADQFVLWRDTAPAVVEVEVRSTEDGLLRAYNVWNSGRGARRESQAATSGMLREETPDGLRYRCSYIGASPTFAALVFRLEM